MRKSREEIEQRLEELDATEAVEELVILQRITIGLLLDIREGLDVANSNLIDVETALKSSRNDENRGNSGRG